MCLPDLRRLITDPTGLPSPVKNSSLIRQLTRALKYFPTSGEGDVESTGLNRNTPPEDRIDIFYFSHLFDANVTTYVLLFVEW